MFVRTRTFIALEDMRRAWAAGEWMPLSSGASDPGSPVYSPRPGWQPPDPSPAGRNPAAPRYPDAGASVSADVVVHRSGETGHGGPSGMTATAAGFELTKRPAPLRR